MVSSGFGKCGPYFPGQFSEKERGIEVTCILDLRGTIPSFLVVTDAKQHEVKVAQNNFLPLSLDRSLVMDEAYIDFQWLYGLKQQRIHFVTRAKENLQYQVIGQQEANARHGVVADEEIVLTGFYSQQKYPEKLRLVTYYDKEHKKTYQFLTNQFTFSAYTISQIYKARAVLTQIWTAMIYYLLLAYIRYQTKYKYSLLYLTGVIRECSFRRADIIDLLNLSLQKVGRLRDPRYELSLF